MISYGMAKARAMAGRDDWNEREAIKSATILWYDTEEEGYELEIENEDDLDAEDFRAWVEENADSLAQEDAAANGTTFEGIEEIENETEWIDDDALFDADYEAACGAAQRRPVAGISPPPHTDAHRKCAPHRAFVWLMRAGVNYTNRRKIPQRSLLLLTLDISAV